MSLLNKIIITVLPIIPKTVTGYFAKPYIAGETLDEAVALVRALNARGMMATIDLLGESISNREDAMKTQAEIERILHEIDRYGLDSNLSIKPTQLGLMMSRDLCEENIRKLCGIAADYGNFIRIDMEDHPYTTVTLDMYKSLRRDFPRRVGTVVQSYLRRTKEDVECLLKDGPTNLRVCKGIYNEPEEIAFKKREEIRGSFLEAVRTLLESGAYAGIATHDDVLIDECVRLVKALGLKREQYEFQMLLGVRQTLRDRLVDEGHRMRVYVPYGKEWFAYSTRRLKENPNMAAHVLKAFFTRK